MEPFARLTATAAPLARANVDTDLILPGRFLTTVSRDGLGPALFSALRYDEGGRERPEFILNRVPWRNARILIAGENFGCGSSREHAAWALAEFGFRCIIAPSFGDTFSDNCTRNGILLVNMEREVVDILCVKASNPDQSLMTIDLIAQRMIFAGGEEAHFDVDPRRKMFLLEGMDEIAQTMHLLHRIEEREALCDPNAMRDIPLDLASQAPQCQSSSSLPTISLSVSPERAHERTQ